MGIVVDHRLKISFLDYTLSWEQKEGALGFQKFDGSKNLSSSFTTH